MVLCDVGDYPFKSVLFDKRCPAPLFFLVVDTPASSYGTIAEKQGAVGLTLHENICLGRRHKHIRQEQERQNQCCLLYETAISFSTEMPHIALIVIVSFLFNLLNDSLHLSFRALKR